MGEVMFSLRKPILTLFAISICSNILAGDGAHLIGWQNFSVDGDGSVSDNTPDTNSTYDDAPVGDTSSDSHYLTGSIGVDASNSGFSGNGIASWNGILNGDNFGGGCEGNGEFIERWPLASTYPFSYVEDHFTSASCVSGTTITLNNTGHSFNSGDSVFISGFQNSSFSGAKILTGTTPNSISYDANCTNNDDQSDTFGQLIDPLFATNKACDGTESQGNSVLVSNKIGQRNGPYGSDFTEAWKFTKIAGTDQDPDDNDGLKGDFSVTNNSSYHFQLQFIHFDARAGNSTCNDAYRAPYLLDVIYLRDSGNLINKEAQQELDVNKLIKQVIWGQCTVFNGSDAPEPRVGVQNVSASISAAIGSKAYLAPGDTATFRFKFNTIGTFAGSNAQIDNIAFEGTFFETAALQSEIDPASVPEPIIENIPMMPFFFQIFLAASLVLVPIRIFYSKSTA